MLVRQFYIATYFSTGYTIKAYPANLSIARPVVRRVLPKYKTVIFCTCLPALWRAGLFHNTNIKITNAVGLKREPNGG